jgi:peroxiredoxin
MAAISTMLPLGIEAPDFTLTSTDGSSKSLDDFEAASALLVMFICNHCPYVKHVETGLTQLADDYLGRGVAMVGICSNDPNAYPDDAPAQLAAQKQRAGFAFPYLIDETQEVARAYRAACTPDFFLFDDHRRLVYRGQMDDSRPGSGSPVTGGDLRAALDAVLTGRPVSDEQRPSMGCSIKWRSGNAPDYRS